MVNEEIMINLIFCSYGRSVDVVLGLTAVILDLGASSKPGRVRLDLGGFLGLWAIWVCCLEVRGFRGLDGLRSLKQ